MTRCKLPDCDCRECDAYRYDYEGDDGSYAEHFCMEYGEELEGDLGVGYCSRFKKDVQHCLVQPEPLFIRLTGAKGDRNENTKTD